VISSATTTIQVTVCNRLLLIKRPIHPPKIAVFGGFDP